METTSSKAEAIAEKILNGQDFPELIFSIVETAEKLFARAGCQSDFCLQSIGPNRIVFGSTNRLVWSPMGFSPDIPYCTAKFLEVWWNFS